MTETTWTRINTGSPIRDTWDNGDVQRPYLFADVHAFQTKAIVFDVGPPGLCLSYEVAASPIGKAWVNTEDPGDYHAAFNATDYAVGTTCTIKTP